MPPWAWHLLLAPLYLVLGVARHELAHAVVALAKGIEVKGIWVLPHWRDLSSNVYYWPGPGRDFFFGYVRFGDGYRLAGNWVRLAPYVVGAALAGLGACVVPWAEATWNWHGWAAAVILCWLSPLADLSWNLTKWLLWDIGDFAECF